jgi:hypothetical protein
VTVVLKLIVLRGCKFKPGCLVAMEKTSEKGYGNCWRSVVKITGFFYAIFAEIAFFE